jgi:hypothetical protein
MALGVRRLALITLVASLALPSCGNSGSEVVPTAPSIPRAVADELANRADEIARLLERGDDCAAASKAHELRQAVSRAKESGSIPAQLYAPLEEAVADLQRLKCTEGGETDGEPTPTATTPTAPTTTAPPATTTGTTTTPETTTSEVTTTTASATIGN